MDSQVTTLTCSRLPVISPSVKSCTHDQICMCTRLLTYATFARMQKLENLHLPQTKCKSHFVYTQNLRICKSGHVNRKQNLHM